MNRKKALSAIAAVAAAAMLCGCGAESTQDASDDTVQTASQVVLDDSAERTTIEFTEDGATIQGSGASEKDGVLTISAGGVYELSGSYAGQVVIDADGQTVGLRLNGVSLTAQDGPAIWAKNAEGVAVVVEDGTTNSVENAAVELAVDAIDPSAAIYAKAPMSISGMGSLTVNGAIRDGINCRDALTIMEVNLTVTAADDGIVGKDSVTCDSGVITIDAAGDGIKSSNDTDETLGWINLSGGTYQITAGNDGIQAETTLTVNGGDYTITTGGGAAQVDSVDESGSYKGMKAGTSLAVSTGTFTFDCADDAVHADSVEILDGTFAIATGDDGVHADSDLHIAGGTIDISQSYEGLEGMTVTIDDGVISIVASDDGVNCAGGVDSSGFGGRFGGWGGGNTDQYVMTINGGTLSVEADGDGLDSNGSIVMTGGTVTVYGPTSSADGSIDYETTCVVTGGTIIAAGSNGMAQAPSSDSTQNSLIAYLTETEAGTAVSVTNAAGDEIAAFTPTKRFSWLLVCSPDIETGETYTVTVGGTELGSATVESTQTVIGNATGMGGFGGGFGGMGGGQGGFGGGFGGGDGQFDGGDQGDGNMTLPDGETMPDGGDFQQGDMTRPDDLPNGGDNGQSDNGMTPPDNNGQMPDGGDFQQGGMTPPDNQKQG
jgi:hypothetical protein